MPKMKTHSGAKKRFSVTRTRKVQARAAAKRHRLTSKSKRMKTEGRSTLILLDMNAKTVLDNFLPYQQKKRRNNRNRQRPIVAKKEAA
jgi:large subunit ribosomal protein L35